MDDLKAHHYWWVAWWHVLRYYNAFFCKSIYLLHNKTNHKNISSMKCQMLFKFIFKQKNRLCLLYIYTLWDMHRGHIHIKVTAQDKDPINYFHLEFYFAYWALKISSKILCFFNNKGTPKTNIDGHISFIVFVGQ